MEGFSPTLPIAKYLLEKASVWEEPGAWLEAWQKFLGQPDQRSLLDWEEVFRMSALLQQKKEQKLEKPSRQGYKVDGGGQ
ncbi:hypothetical protein [Microbulbifer sp. TRSA005]|uniref:hypothetical protein n=1 Tax=Microbulbifer sp. TRSA005 TaxID=3243383 RepID=UPI00403A0DCD